jgi:UDP-glucose 4-epimerase
MKIAVTGGLGYVGRALLRQLAAEPANRLHVIDNMASGAHRLEAMDASTFELHVADVQDRAAMQRILGEVQPDLVYHLAAIHAVSHYESDPGKTVGVNVAGTVNLLDAMPRGARFVFASSAAVYAPRDAPHDEASSPAGPIDVYGWTKYHGEQFVRFYAAAGKVDGVIVRLFNVVGSGETNPHLAPAVIGQLANGADRVRLGNLFPQRDYIDVDDAALGFRKIAAVAGEGEGALCCNLGTGRSHAVRDVVISIAKAAGIDLVIEQDEARARAVDRPMMKASTELLERLTGWRPRISLDQSMAQAWESRREDRLQ